MLNWSPMPVRGMFIAGFGRDRGGRFISALVAGTRSDWHYQIQRRDEGAPRVETLGSGSAARKLDVMRAAEEAGAAYFRADRCAAQ